MILFAVAFIVLLCMVALVSRHGTIEAGFVVQGVTPAIGGLPMVPEIAARNTFGMANSEMARYRLAVETLIEMSALKNVSVDAILDRKGVQLSDKGAIVYPRKQ
jgi:hypothetical protein